MCPEKIILGSRRPVGTGFPQLWMTARVGAAKQPQSVSRKCLAGGEKLGLRAEKTVTGLRLFWMWMNKSSFNATYAKLGKNRDRENNQKINRLLLYVNVNQSIG